MNEYLFTVTLANRARKFVKSLPDHYKRRVAELLLILQENPAPSESFDVVKLKGFLDTFRVHLGDIRVIYAIDWSRQEVRVLTVSQREKAYSGFP